MFQLIKRLFIPDKPTCWIYGCGKAAEPGRAACKDHVASLAVFKSRRTGIDWWKDRR